MFNWKQNQNPLYRQYYTFALIGFAVLSLGYLGRSQGVSGSEALRLLLAVFPNLLGSFATPFVLMLLLSERLQSDAILRNMPLFGLVNLFTFAGSLVIEALHVTFKLGRWDPNDLLASAAGGLIAIILFTWASRRTADMRYNNNENQPLVNTEGP